MGASLWGVLFLGNWPSTSERILGGMALILIIIGATLTVWMEKRNQESTNIMKKAILILALGEIGYLTYSAAPQATNIDGMTAFLPQTMGMLFVALIYSAVVSLKGRRVFTERVSYGNIVSGFLFAFAALTYLISAQPNMNGISHGLCFISSLRCCRYFNWNILFKTAKNKKGNACDDCWIRIDSFCSSVNGNWINKNKNECRQSVGRSFF